MTTSRIAVPVLVASLWIAACSSDPPPPPPTPEGPTEEELARRRADSLAELREKQDSLARVRAEERRQEQLRAQRTAAARATLEEMVFFEYDRSDITPQAERVLRQKVEILRASPAVQILIEGHADERGSTEYNQALGNRRAESVRQFFVDFGLDPDRFAIVSYGEEQPLVNESNEAAWARNRRAEFVLTAGEGRINPVTSSDG